MSARMVPPVMAGAAGRVKTRRQNSRREGETRNLKVLKKNYLLPRRRWPQPEKYFSTILQRSSFHTAWQAGHPCLAVLMSAEGVDAGPAPGMTMGGRCQRVRISGAWYDIAAPVVWSGA